MKSTSTTLADRVRTLSHDRSTASALSRGLEAWAERAIRPLMEVPLITGTLFNVNFPALAPEAVKGIRVCRQGIRDYGRLRIVERTDPRGYRYYWFGLAPTVETAGHETDLEVVADGYVAVTPLHLDLTHEQGLATVAERFSQA